MKKLFTLLYLLILTALTVDAQTWESFAGGLGNGSGAVKAIAEDPVTHSIYAGGTFTSPIAYLARWNGSAWEAVGTGVNGPVYALAFKNSELYVGGQFTAAGGTPVNNVAKWVSPNWTDVGGGFNGQVNCLFVSTLNGSVYAGGNFTLSNSNTMNHVAKLVSTSWNQVGTGIGSIVNAFTEFNGVLYAGTENVGAPVSKFDGSVWSTISGLTGGKVYALASFSNYLYAGGDFSSPTIAAAKYDGTTWGTIQTTFGIGDKIYAFYRSSNNILYIGGKFVNLGIPSNRASYAAKILSPTTPIQGITLSSSTISGEVYAINGLNSVGTAKAIVGGDFSAPVENIAITSLSINVDELSGLVIAKSFYPNPVKSTAHVRIQTSERLRNPAFKIYDMQSRLVEGISVDIQSAGNTLEASFDCSGLSSGNYFYQLTEDGISVLSDKFTVN